jgi:hypothetical protein
VNAMPPLVLALDLRSRGAESRTATGTGTVSKNGSVNQGAAAVVPGERMAAFDRTTALIVTALVAVSWVEPHAFQDQSTAQRSAQVGSPLSVQTPGSVALLANRSDAATLEQLRIALSHADPVVRAVAARVARRLQTDRSRTRHRCGAGPRAR